MGQFQLVSFDFPEKGTASLLFANPDSPGLAVAVNQFFASRGYKLSQGVFINGVYETGSAAARVLVGGFAKRAKFQVNIAPHEGMSWLRVSKAMSGMAGGIIGVSQMNSEFSMVVEGLKQL